jgi:hypothetical protein
VIEPLPIELVGGPWDGARLEIPADYPLHVVALPSGSDQHDYRRTRRTTDTGRQRWVWLCAHYNTGHRPAGGVS